MRPLVDADRLRLFMRAIGAAAAESGRVYLTGGATAVLVGWRSSTIDVDMKMDPEQDSIFRALSTLKETLQINIEMASPGDFIPELPGWQDRSPFIAKEGRISFHNYDFYSQCLSKIERGHARDAKDVRQMLARGMVEPDRLMGYFETIEPLLYRYPAIDPPSFRKAVERMKDEARPPGGKDER